MGFPVDWVLRARLLGVVTLCLILFASPLLAADLPAFRPNDALTRRALERFYNMDYDPAIADLEKVANEHGTDAKSQDPFAINNLLNCYLVRELYRMGALDPADYLRDNFIGSPKRPAGADSVKTITDLLARATAIEEDRLQNNPNDANMLYARGVTRALRSSYTGLIQRSWFGALRSAEGARRDHERVLKLSPAFTDANLIVGTHDYVLGNLPWAIKTAASVVGFTGSRDRGIEELHVAADGEGQASIDAKILLALFLRREGRIQEALQLVRKLVQLFPQNLIFAMQEGDMLRALGRRQEALAAYRGVWEKGQKGQFSISGFEKAAINMGEVQRSLHDEAGALASYNLLEQTPQGAQELRQNAFLRAGEIYDLQRNRNVAVEKYQAVIAMNSSSEWAEQARRHLKRPYSNAARMP